MGWGLAALTLVLGVAFVAVDLAYNQGHLIAPLDDTYIHLQYGRQLGSGHFFQYNTGDPVSTGASSLLYALVLGLGYAIGFHGGSFLAFAMGLGILCLAATSAATYAVGRRLVGTQVGGWAGVLVALSGPLLWGAASGMEVGLTALLVMTTLLAFVREASNGRLAYAPVVAALLGLARPEGLIFAVVLCGAMVGTIICRVRRRGTTLVRGLVRATWCLLPIAAGAGQYLFYLMATGTVAANGVQAKSYLDNVPVVYPFQVLDKTLINLRAFVDVFSGLSTRDFTFPGALVCFLLGIAFLLLVRPQWRILALALGVAFGAVLVAVSTLDTAQVHNLRYVQPFLPVFLLLTVIGGYGMTTMVARGHSRRLLSLGLLTMALVFSLAGLPKWGVRLGQESATIRDVPISVGAWIGGNLPADAVIGVKDVGAARYFGGHRVVDLVGLTTNGLAEASNNGVGTLYEALRHLPSGQRPDYFAIFDTPPGPPIDELREAGLLGPKPLATFDVQTPISPTDGLIVPFQHEAVYRADWRLAGTGDQPQVAPAGQVRDYLNVGDLASERAHRYQPRMAQVGVQPMSTLARFSVPGGPEVLDSGRRILGEETFTAHHLLPGRPLTITARTDVTGPVRGLRVVVNDVSAGEWRLAPDPDDPAAGGASEPTNDAGDVPKRWRETSFTVPANLVTGADVTMRLAADRPLRNPYPNYLSFGYWFSQ